MGLELKPEILIEYESTLIEYQPVEFLRSNPMQYAPSQLIPIIDLCVAKPLELQELMCALATFAKLNRLDVDQNRQAIGSHMDPAAVAFISTLARKYYA